MFSWIENSLVNIVLHRNQRLLDKYPDESLFAHCGPNIEDRMRYTVCFIGRLLQVNTARAGNNVPWEFLRSLTNFK